MVLDVFELGRLAKGHRVVPVQMSHPAMEVRVPASDFALSVILKKKKKKGGELTVADVALEVLHVDWVEADDGCEETDVCFGDVRR